MSVALKQITVIVMQPVPTLMDRLLAHVTVVTLDLAFPAQVHRIKNRRL